MGLEGAGFRVAACVEIDEDCRSTLALNRPSWRAERKHGDVTRLGAEGILSVARMAPGEAALVTGGAPCQPFSLMGKQEGTACDDGNLFLHFMRVVRELEPTGFVFENVQGMQSRHRPVVAAIVAAGERAGYRVSARVLNAADYGVPQRRKRLIVLGLRRCRATPYPAFPWPTHAENPGEFVGRYAERGFEVPRPLPWVTVSECFGGIAPEEFGREDCKCMGVSPLMRERISHIRPGTRDNFKVLPDDLKPACWRTGKHQGNDTFGRLAMDAPAVTIRTCGYHPMKGRYIHPVEGRGLNTVEMARLQGFPPAWRFHGGLISVGRQIGNAVPPPLAQAIGRVMACQMAAR